jgi:hypothetical protein
MRPAREPARLRALRELSVGFVAAVVAMLFAAAVVIIVWQLAAALRPRRSKRPT